MEGIQEKGYKLVTAGATALETVIKPSAETVHTLIHSINEKAHDTVDSTLEAVESATSGYLSWFTGPLRDVNNAINYLTFMGIEASNIITTESIEAIDEHITEYSTEMEKYFEEVGIPIHQNWEFSTENREVIRKIAALVKENIQDISDLPIGTFWQYLAAWSIVQSKARELDW